MKFYLVFREPSDPPVAGVAAKNKKNALKVAARAFGYAEAEIEEVVIKKPRVIFPKPDQYIQDHEEDFQR